MQPTVVLLHGLGRSARAMHALKRRLAAEGYPTWSTTYPSRTAPLKTLAAEVEARIRADLGDVPLIGVTHSMGGIVARHMTEVRWQRLVMLAPPNQGSRVARFLKDNPLFRHAYGPAGQQVANPSDWPIPTCPTAVIAGTKRWSWANTTSWLSILASLFGPDEDHDGTVGVSETKFDGVADFATVEASHTWMMFRRDVADMVVRSVSGGRLEAETLTSDYPGASSPFDSPGRAGQQASAQDIEE